MNIITNEDVVVFAKHSIMPTYLKSGYMRCVYNTDVILEAENACAKASYFHAAAIGCFFLATVGGSMYMWTSQNYTIVAIIVGAYVAAGIAYYNHILAQRPTPFTRNLNHLCRQMRANLGLTVDEIMRMRSQDLTKSIKAKLDHLASVVILAETEHGRDSEQQIETKKVFDYLYKYSVKFDLVPADKKIYFNKSLATAPAVTK